MREGQARLGREVHVPEMSIDGNLGMPFLSKWLVMLDLARSRVWFQPGGTGGDAPSTR